MKVKKTFPAFLIIIGTLFYILLSCSNKENKILESMSINDGTTVVFDYDEGLRLVKTSHYSRGKLEFTRTINYGNNSGRIVVESKPAEGREEYADALITFVRDNNKILYSFAQKGGTLTVNNDGYIIQNNVHHRNVGDYEAYGYEYPRTQPTGNLSSITDIIINNSLTVSNVKTEFTYDDKPSPFYNDKTPKWLLQYLYRDIGLYNNITLIKIDTIETSFEYNYMSGGFPSKQTKISSAGGDKIITNFKYSNVKESRLAEAETAAVKAAGYEASLPGFSYPYTTILNGDLSAFAGNWVNAKGERIQLRADGTFGSGETSRNFSRGVGSSMTIATYGIDYNWSNSAKGFVMLFPPGVIINSSEISGTDETQVRLLIGFNGPKTNADIFYPESAGTALQTDGYAKIINGDFSEYEGIWQNGKGERRQLFSNGVLAFNEYHGLMTSGITHKIHASGETYYWWVNEDELGGYAVGLFPPGEDVISAKGDLIETDKTKVRMYSGYHGPLTSDEIFYPSIAYDTSGPVTTQGGAMLWVNGEARNLNIGHTSSALSVFVSGSDIYVSGWASITEDYSRAVLWKNGESRMLSDKHSSASSVFVSGVDVYIAGWINSEEGYKAMLWKNGSAEALSAALPGRTQSSSATSVFVCDSDVYVAGSAYMGEFDNAVLWKNGAIQILMSESYTGRAKSVFVSDGDVYVVGEIYPSGVGEVIVWKNGEVHLLISDSSYEWSANYIFVSGEDVYVTGHAWQPGGGYAVLWKNGMEQQFTNASALSSVFVSGNNVYLAGTGNNPNASYKEYFIIRPDSSFRNIARIWINGVPGNLTDGTRNAAANSVFVSGGNVYAAGQQW